jgi:Uncharacterised protein family (UPF0175)
MEVAISLPDDVAQQPRAQWGEDIPRHVLESMALEGYRSGVLGEESVRRLLGLASRFEVHVFLAAHQVPLNYTLEYLAQDRHTARRRGM